MRNSSRSLSQSLAPLLLIIATALSGCVGEIDPLFSFQIERDMTATVPASSTGFDTTFTFNITDAGDEFQSKQTSRELLESVTASRFAIVANSALNQIDSLEYYISADTLPRLKIASIGPLESSFGTAFDPENINLAQYFSRAAFNLEIRAVSSQQNLPELPLTFQHTFFVVARPR